MVDAHINYQLCHSVRLFSTYFMTLKIKNLELSDGQVTTTARLSGVPRRSLLRGGTRWRSSSLLGRVNIITDYHPSHLWENTPIYL